jgi:hypothetical protein
MINKGIINLNLTGNHDTISFDWVLWFQWLMATSTGWFFGGILIPGIGLLSSGIGIGIFQSLILSTYIERSWRWMILTVIGWSFGWLINLVTVPEQNYAMNGIAIGVSTGLAQWLIIKKEVQLSFWWIIVTTASWMSGIALFPGIMLPGVVAGGVTGIALVLLLQFPSHQNHHSP